MSRRFGFEAARRRVRAIAPALALALAAALPGHARAQDPKHHAGDDEEDVPVHLGIAGGVSLPTSTTRQALGDGLHANAFALVRLSTGFFLKLDVGYQRFAFRQAANGLPSPSGNSQLLSATAGTQVFLSGGAVRPYFTGGIGGFEVLSSTAGQATTNQLKPGITGGAGLTIRLGPVSAFLEGQVQNVFTDHQGIPARSIEAVPVSVGLLF